MWIPVLRSHLIKLGITQSKVISYDWEILEKLGHKTEVKIKYDYYVTKEIDEEKSEVVFLRSGDKYDERRTKRKDWWLDGLQDFLKNEVGRVLIYTKKLTELPDLSHIRKSDIWPN